MQRHRTHSTPPLLLLLLLLVLLLRVFRASAAAGLPCFGSAAGQAAGVRAAIAGLVTVRGVLVVEVCSGYGVAGEQESCEQDKR